MLAELFGNQSYTYLKNFQNGNLVRITNKSLNKFMRRICGYYFPSCDEDSLFVCPEVKWDEESEKSIVIGSINFSNTNANFNFSNAFSVVNTVSGCEEINLSDCDFVGTDLSHSSFESVDTATNCDFTDSGLRIVLSDNNNNLRQSLKTCYIDGCYINGRLVDSRVVDEDKKAALKAQSDALFAKYVSIINDGELIPVEGGKRGRH